MNMKKCLLLMLVVLTGIVSSCKYDDDELWGSVDDLANRVSALETLTKQMNSDISALQAVITAVQNQVAVSEVEKLTDGYILHFTNGTTATIKNGTDGKDGANGENGADGEDGKDGADGKDGKDAPAIGVAKDGDVYYWTITIDGETDWLTDDAGNKLPVTGEAGADGEDGKDAASGSTGAAGKDGITPLLKIDATTFEWMVSYDNGTTYMEVKGSANAQPTDGTNGVAMFESVVATEETVTITMKDGNVYVIPLLKSLGFTRNGESVDIKNIQLTDAEIGAIQENGQLVINLDYTLDLQDAKHSIVTEDGCVKANVDESNKQVTLTLTDTSLKEDRAVILFFNETKTLTAVFKFKTATWNGDKTGVAVTPVGNTYHIATASNLVWVANQVNGGNKFEGKTILLENDLDLSGGEWTPIGSNGNNPFSGTFDGNGMTIKGLKIGGNASTASVVGRSLSRANDEITGAGLFGVVMNAILKAITITDAVVNPDKEVTGAGILVGSALGSVQIENVTIQKETAKEPSVKPEEPGTPDAPGTPDTPDTSDPVKDVTGSQNVGSVVGYISGDQIVIKSCEVTNTSLTASTEQTSATESSSVGGVVGTINITSDNAKIEVSGCTVGGVEIEAASSSNSSESTTSGNNSVGGIVGSLTVDDSVSLEKVDMSQLVGNTVADATIVVPEDTKAEDVEYDAVVGNSGSFSDEVKESINQSNTSQNVVVEAVVTIENEELSTVLLAELGADKVTINNNRFAEMKVYDVEAVTELDFSSKKNYKITKLGVNDIGKFKNLRRLDCRDTQLEECDLSQNKELVYANIQYNELTTLDFSNNKNLDQLICSYNPDLVSLNLENCTLLTSLQTQDTGLSELNIPNKNMMSNLLYGNTRLADVIDLNEYPNISSLGIHKLGYTSIDDVIPDNLKANIHTLFCEGNKFETLDLSEFPNLINLTCYDNKLETLDVSMLPNMDVLQCGNQQDNGILILTIAPEQQNIWETKWKTNSPNVYLRNEVVIIENTELSAALQDVLDADKVTLNKDNFAVISKEYAESVTELNIKSNTYTIHSMVGIEYFINLKKLNCQLSGVEKCDLSKNTKLEELMMGGNNLTSLDCSNNTELTALMLENNKNLESLNISGCANLKYLILTNTKLNTITVPNPENIFQLSYSKTSLKLDLSVFTGLRILSCYGNDLTSINLTPETKAKLTSLDCYSNNIESLDLKEYPSLSKLNCKDNLLKELDITSLEKLDQLNCGVQKNNIVLKLKLTAAQKEKWDSTWGTDTNNQRVDAIVEVTEGTGSGNDFGNGGVF